MNGRASACQVYPRTFCAQLCLGLKEELQQRALGAAARPLTQNMLGHAELGNVVRELLEVFEPHPLGDIEYMEYLYTAKEFFDDVHGKWLDKTKAIEARRLELKFFREMGVHESP